MHIHVPDGVLPTWLWVSGYLLSLFFLAIVLRKTKEDVKIPLTAMMVALMLIVMSVPLGLPVHINLSVLTGLIVGPLWSLIASFIVNLILASFGHGGLTIVGLNTLVLWAEAIVGIYSFKLLRKMTKNYFSLAAISTFLALVFSTLMVIGIVAVSTINPGEFIHHEYLEISLRTFIILILPVSLLGAVVESMITGFIVSYMKKVKPKLIP